MRRKIAAVTEDGLTLSSHFGMAPEYLVFMVEGERILAEEKRPKPHHQRHPDHHVAGHGAAGHDAAGHGTTGHADMFAPIADCQALLCGGMGAPAYQKALQAGLEVVLTGGEIRLTLQAYLEGRLSTDLRRVHQH